MREQYFQLNLLWPRDATKLRRYEEILGPILSSRGAVYERQFSATSIVAENLQKPGAANVVRFPTLQAFIAFQHDQRLRDLAELRRESLSVATVEGSSLRSGAITLLSDDREYLIEIVRFGPRGRDEYNRYEMEAAPVLRRYGYSVERMLKSEFTGGLPFQADFVKIAYFDGANGFQRLQADPDYSRVKDWHSSATRNSIWISGKTVSTYVQPSRNFS